LQPLDLLIVALATWRVAFLVTKEDAPMKVMKNFREKHPDWGVFSCIYCASIWVALVLFAAWQVPVLQYGVDILAISGAALMLASYSGANHV